MGRAALALLAAACLAALAGGGARLAGAAGPLAEGARATVDTVSDSCLNVRAEPALAAPVLACLPEGTGVAARGRRAEADGYEWEAVRAGGALEGWAAAGFLARPGDPSGAPDIGAPPERGLALIAWPGGPLEGLAGAVAARGGCALRAAWGNGPDGGIVRYRFGASDAVNRAFLDARGGVPPAGTLLLLVCAGEALAQPPPAPPPPRAALRYGPLDATGEAATPGSYAFLDADGEAIPSWARLRNAATLRVHRTDADGEDRAALYGGAAAGDLVVEGRTADDCWIRFRATAAPATPPPGSARWEFPVEWTAYARAGCADAARAGAGAAVAWGAPPDLRTADIASPVRHGPWLLVPTDWEGLPAARSGRALRLAGEAVEPQSPEAAAAPYPPAETADPDEARRLIPLWRDPALPEGWTLAGAEIGTRNAPPLGYRARYADAQGRTALQIEARPIVRRPDYQWVARGGGAAVTEARTIDGRPALVRYSPRGPAHDPDLSVFVRVFDPETGIEYALRGYHASLRGGDAGAAIAIARSLYQLPAAAADAPKRYNRLDANGEVAMAGSWAILGADGAVLTTWEALRSEAATLRLHQADADGASQAAAYGSVESGDIIEWRKADDCWVRYLVTAAPARPASGSLRWEFPVEWMTYAATGAGCTGAVGATDVLRVDEDAPSVIPASEITSPVRHGPYLVYPQGWTGALETQAWRSPPAPAAGGADGASATATPVTRGITGDLTEARRFRYWRDPVLPAGWTFAGAETGTPDAPPYGYTAVYRNVEGYYGVQIYVRFKTLRPQHREAVYLGGAIVNEPRTIDGRAAVVHYSPQGPAHDRLSGVWAWIFDAETGIEYGVRGYDYSLSGSNADAALAIARSLLPPAAP